MPGDITKTNCYEKLIIVIQFCNVKLRNSSDPVTIFG